MKKENSLQIRWVGKITDIAREQWDCLALPLETPLLEWAWLHALEACGSISPRQGWKPCHLTVWQGSRLVGAAPLYIKTHSDGEFVFDHWWARLAGDFGIPYYPKLVGMSPVTPAVGYRFLIAPDADPQQMNELMFSAIDRFCGEKGLSGCHLNFVDPCWQEVLDSGRFTAWRHQSYLWRNTDLTSFDDYLDLFRSVQRRNIRRERQSLTRQKIAIRSLHGDEIDAAMAEPMYNCYLNTNLQYGPWAAKYLNAEFFKIIFRQFRHRLLVMAAYETSRRTRPLALSMLLFKNRQLIGRYWGSLAFVKDLHFNMCFYEPIDWAIQNGISTFDPGAGSPHKIQRGFAAVINTSLHRFYDPRLRALFMRFIDSINDVETANVKALNEKVPFSKAR